MRKVISGKMYDTQTAEKLGEWNSKMKGMLIYERAVENSYGGYWEEAVYRKKQGNTFCIPGLIWIVEQTDI